jgi:hypothetical protein
MNTIRKAMAVAVELKSGLNGLSNRISMRMDIYSKFSLKEIMTTSIYGLMAVIDEEQSISNYDGYEDQEAQAAAEARSWGDNVWQSMLATYDV